MLGDSLSDFATAVANGIESMGHEIGNARFGAGRPS
jgi:hypothetical protein